MDTMIPWLLLVLAALIVACVSLFYQLRQVESQSRGREMILSDELRDAEAALLSALEKVRNMDTSLAAREHNLAAQHPLPSPPRTAVEGASMPVRNRPRAIVLRSRRATGSTSRTTGFVGRGQDGSHCGSAREPGRASDAASSVPHGRLRAIELARTGQTPLEIARELELPVGEVELVIALQSRQRSSL